MKRFKAASDEEREHAQKLMNYQVQFFTAISSVGHQAAYVVLDKLVALIHTLASPPGYPWRTCQAA